VGGEPDILFCPDVPDQFFEDPDARAVAADVRVHGELEQAAFAVGGIEFAPVTASARRLSN
jgi:hypothetical protein